MEDYYEGREWSTFMDGDDCNECRNYERDEKKLRKRIKQLESAMQDAYSLILSIQNSRKGHAPNPVYCDKLFDIERTDKLAAKFKELLK